MSQSDRYTKVYFMRHQAQESAWVQDVKVVPRVGDMINFQDHCQDTLMMAHEGALLITEKHWRVLAVVHALSCKPDASGKHLAEQTVWVIICPESSWMKS